MEAGKTKNVCVFGLGSMGFGIASSLVKAGHTTAGFDLDKSREDALQQLGGSVAGRQDALKAADVTVLVVINAQQVEELLFGDQGFAKELRKGSCVIGCTTVSPDVARRCEETLSALGIHYLDAPISGGSVKAADGELTIMASGSEDAFTGCESVLDAIAELVFRLGNQAGPASAMKVVNQLLAGVHIAAAAEAMTFGMTQGIDPKQTLEVISKCAGTSWMFENRGAHIVSGDYTPHSAVDIFVKDLGIVIDTARAAKFSAPLTATALQQFVAASGAGYGREDDAAVAKIYARNAGLELP